MANFFSEFRITNGTTTVDLLSLSSKTGLHLKSWSPQVTQPKSTSVWSDPALADGGEPRTEALANVTEPMTFDVVAWTENDLFEMVADLRYLLREAKRYWMTGFQTDPVWIERRSASETNTGYAMVMAGTCPEESDPFYPTVVRENGATVAYLDWPAQIIREPLWRECAPGTTVCQEAYGAKETCYPCHVEFDGADTIITVADNAAIQDLHDAAMTVEAWIYPSSDGEGDEGWIIGKGDAGTVGWHFRFTNADNSLRAIINCATTDGVSQTSIQMTMDTHSHVAFTWDDATYNYPRMWVNGVEYTDDVSTRNGAIVTDVGDDLYIGNRNDVARTFDGHIGWVRVSDSVRYTTTFDPPNRCRIPDIDANTVAIWIGGECSGATIDNMETTAALDGTLADGDFDCDCWTLSGQVVEEAGGEDVPCAGDYCADPTCDADNYIINASVTRQITHMFVYDASGPSWSDNLIGTAGPISLFPPAPANGDRLWIGVSAGHPGAARFGNIVWDITTPQEALTMTPYYYTGALTSLYGVSHRDNTNTDPTGAGATATVFTVEGVNSFVWTSSPMTAQVVNGVNGYWMVYNISAVGGAPVVPVASRPPYTVTWPFLEVDDSDLGGDEAAPLALSITNESQYSTGSTYGATSIIHLGAREKNRGEDFTAFLRCGDEELLPGQTVTVGANTAFQSGAGDPNTNRRTARYTPIADPEAMATRITITLDETLGPHFYGDFHVYLRMLNGSVNTINNFRIGVQNGSSGGILWGETVIFVGTNRDYVPIDLGRITIGEADPSITFDEIDIYIQIGLLDADPIITPIDVLDIFLQPTDECSGTFTMLADNTFETPEYAYLDSAEHPREEIRALVLDANDYQVGRLLCNATSLILQPKRNQRIWFLTSSIWTTEPTAYPYMMHSVQAHRVRMYKSMRGAN